MGKFSQIEKNSLGSKQNLHQNFLEKVCIRIRFQNYSVFTCTFFGSVCTNVYTNVHFCTLIIHVHTMTFIYTHSAKHSSTKDDNRQKSVPLLRRKFLKKISKFLRITAEFSRIKKNSHGSTRNMYQNLFQTILSNFGFEPRSKDILSFGQILSNRKKFSRIVAKSIKISLKKFLSDLDFKITAFLHVHSLKYQY